MPVAEAADQLPHRVAPVEIRACGAGLFQGGRACPLDAVCEARGVGIDHAGVHAADVTAVGLDVALDQGAPRVGHGRLGERSARCGHATDDEAVEEDEAGLS